MPIRKYSFIACACWLLGTAGTASAQEKLEIPKSEAWIHSHSGIVVPAVLTGIERSDAIAYAGDALNSSVTFERDGEALSIYVYRNTSGGVPVWFEQARHGIETRDIYANPTEVGTTRSFSLPGRDIATGLRTVYAMPEGARFASTGLALFVLGEWYVKIRASSVTRDAAALDAWMTDAIDELTLPESLSAGGPASPVTVCSNPLVFKKEAKDAPADAGAALLAGVLGTIVMNKTAEVKNSSVPPQQVNWCRDSELGNNQTVYRPNASTQFYLIALGDSGIGVSVGSDQAASILRGSKKTNERYTATMHFDDENVHFVAQDRLPSPRRVVQLINGKRVATTVSTWGEKNSVEINASEL